MKEKNFVRRYSKIGRKMIDFEVTNSWNSNLAKHQITKVINLEFNFGLAVEFPGGNIAFMLS